MVQVTSVRPEEGEQVGVDLVLMCGGDAVRRAGIVDVLGALDQPGGLDGGILDRNDLVILPVQDERRHVELLQVFGEVGLRECLDAFIGVQQAGLHAPEPELVECALGDV